VAGERGRRPDVTKLRCRWIVGTVALAVVATSLPVDAAPPRNRKVFKATVEGKRWKPLRRSIGLGVGGGTIGFLASGAKPARSLRGISKTVLLSCVNDLSTQTFPYTTTDCLTAYTEIRARPFTQRNWQNLEIGATEVTFDTFDGVYIAGRFHAVVPPHPGNPELSPIMVEGEFRGPVTQDESAN
jgi:hypothetical protein